jgi:hypothetical protein
MSSSAVLAALALALGANPGDSAQLDFTLTDEKGQVLLRGATTVSDDKPLSFEHKSADTPEAIELTVNGRVEPNEVNLQVHFKERGLKAGHVEWSPRLRGKRGEALTAMVEKLKLRRTLTLTVR